MADNCIFCRIIKGEVPADKINESENFIVIRDVSPKTQGHSLVIPKKHYKTFLDIPSILHTEFLDVVKESTLKLIKETNSEGFNLVMNNYEVAGQVVPHAHLHIIPRKKNDDFKLKSTI